MSLNGAALLSNNSLATYEGEKVFCTANNVKMYLETGGGYPGVGGTHYSQKGNLVLTNKRIVYILSPPTAHVLNVEFFFEYLKNVTLRPAGLLSHGEIQANVFPAPGGGLPSAGTVKFTFIDGDAGEFHSFYLHAESYISNRPKDEQLPMYAEDGDGSSSEPPPPDYN